MVKKVKVSLRLINYAPHQEDVWESGGVAPPFLTSALDGRERSASLTCRFTPEEVAPQYPLQRRLGEPQIRSDLMKKIKICFPYGESNPSVVQPVA
jgi:hypothetical protein